jgi:endonuclease YncB( thermonuclease family)
VSDGDTIKVMLNGKAQTIRLYGIDCPEKSQAYGQRAKQYTSGFVFGKAVKVYSKGTDRYGRVLAWVFVDGRCVNADLVSNGLAWWYRQYSPKETKLAQLEAQARAKRLGLWADAAPVAPWDYRRPKRTR